MTFAFCKKIFGVSIAAAFVFILAISCKSDEKKYGTLGSPGDKVPLVSEARHGVLPNGLSYYVLENKKPGNRAYLTLAVDAGSVLETDDQQGLAHFVEHMAFEGTSRFPKNELDTYLRSLGMRFGPDFNAFTSYEETVYEIVVPTEANSEGVKQIPEKALEILDDWTHSILFQSNEVDKERLIVLEEYRSRLGVADRMYKVLLPVLFEGSQYAERRPIGVPEVIENAPPDVLKTFYNKWYRADNMAVILVGDFDAESVEESLLSHFTLPKPDSPLDKPIYDLPPPQKGNVKTLIFTDSEETSTDIALYYKRPFKPQNNSLEDFRNALIDSLIDTMLGFRFEEAEQKIDTPCFNIGSANFRYVRRSLYYYMGATAKTGRAAETLKMLLEQKESLGRYGFLDSEIERAKQDFLASWEERAAEKEKINSQEYISSFTGHFLRKEDAAGVDWILDAVKTLLPLISAKDLHNAVKDYFSAGDLLVFISANEADRDSLPSDDEIISLVKESTKLKLEKPRDAVINGELLRDLPAKGSISEESIDNDSSTLIWDLSNGARVLLKSTENKNDQIQFYALAKGGITSVPLNDIPSAKLASEITNASGVGDWNLNEITKMLTGKQVSLSFNASLWARSIEGSSTNADLKTFFELLYLRYTAPRLEEEAAEIIKEQHKTILAQKLDNPESYFYDEAQKIIYDNNPYIISLQGQDIENFDIESARSFILRCLNPSDYIFAFVGNIDLDAIRPLVENYLASIPQKESFNTAADIKINYPDKLDKAIYKGKEEKSLVFLNHSLHKKYNANDGITTEVLSAYLDILLTEVARQKLNMVYGISPNVSASPFPPDGLLDASVYFVCDPKHVEGLSSAVENELMNIAGGAIDPDMFKNAKLSLVKNRETLRESNGYIARSLANYSKIFDLPLSYIDRKSELYESTQASDIIAAARSLFNGSFVRIVLYPEGAK
ncbi:MAG: insulinase family protein [Spirochaetaceae bacterium]|jgi:zinc protease|nr:insulinase family protein [Spirochaetaceae bacterium]